MGKRETKIVNASIINLVGNSLLAIAKIAVGVISGSLAVIADGIDSATDIIAAIVTIVTARIMTKSPNIKYPYGYAKAEPVATKYLAFLIFFAGAQLAITTVSELTSGVEKEIPSMIAIYVTVFSILAKIGLSIQQYRAGKKLESEMLIANARNMRNDIYTSSSVLLGLVFTMVLELSILDTITAMAISIWIMKSAYDIFMQTNTELMEGIEDRKIYKDILKVIDSVEEAKNPHRIRVRKFAHKYVIELDFEVEGDMTVNESHDISNIVEDKIKEKIPNVYDIITHVDPLGKKENDEKFGISKDNVDGVS